MEDILNTEFLNLPLSQWFTAVAIAAGGVIVAILVRSIAAAIVRRRRARAEAETEGGKVPPGYLFALRMVNSFVFPALILAGIYAAIAGLDFDGEAGVIVSSVFVVLFSLVIIRFLIAVINELFLRAADDEHHLELTKIRPLRAIAVFLVWTVGLLFLLQNLGFDITAVVAGLGIGGIAIALAAQALLGDLFAYFVILLDKPFVLGDFLIFGDILGSVERIGIKTTRLRSLGGEQIIIANGDLTSSRIRNYTRMEQRRIVFKIGVVYGTPAEQVREIPSIIQSIVESEELAKFDRAHFASYGDWSLVFEVVYYVASPDYNLYMGVQQRINFAIYDEFSSRGIDFAFPTQTLKLERASE